MVKPQKGTTMETIGRPIHLKPHSARFGPGPGKIHGSFRKLGVP